MTAILETLKSAGLSPNVKVNADNSARITVWAANESHPREERIEIDVDSSGKVSRSSKYAYLLPASVGDEIRLS